MSALARYFHTVGKVVGGYDRSETSLTRELTAEGIDINYSDEIGSIPQEFRDTSDLNSILIIYTPAVPDTAQQLRYFRKNFFKVLKRSQVLGAISDEKRTIAIGGSHGKTTISAMVTEIFKISNLGCSAFLGGISKSLNSNFLLSAESEWVVVEADEFDKSFLTLHPDMALVSSMDSDHLDVYGDKNHLENSFKDFLSLIEPKGKAVLKEGLNNIAPPSGKIDVKYYGLQEARDYYAVNIERDGLFYKFDIRTPNGTISNFKTSVPGWINIENAVGAASLGLEAGLEADLIREGISNFLGIKRRFDIRINNQKIVYMDDYAHHPKEIKYFIQSIRKLFPDKKLTGIFQPHLYSRTRDFAKEFGHELSALDELILLDIYPAREEAIEGVSSRLILAEVEMNKKILVEREGIMEVLKDQEIEVLVTMGAGDIDQLVEPIEEYLESYDS